MRCAAHEALARSNARMSRRRGGKARRAAMPASFHVKSRANRESPRGELPRDTHRLVVFSARRADRGDSDHEVALREGRALNRITGVGPTVACESLSPMPPVRDRD